MGGGKCSQIQKSVYDMIVFQQRVFRQLQYNVIITEGYQQKKKKSLGQIGKVQKKNPYLGVAIHD